MLAHRVHYHPTTYGFLRGFAAAARIPATLNNTSVPGYYPVRYFARRRQT